MPKIALQSLGCRLNEAELESWARAFRRQGHHIVMQPEQADIVVINTCAVTTEAARKSRQLIRRCRRGNKNARLVVSGCYASLNAADVGSMGGIDVVVPNAQKRHLVGQALAPDREPPATAKHTADTAIPVPHASPGLLRGRHRAFVKVQDGCRHRCTFCVVTLARGDESSRPDTDILSEIRQLTAVGVQEVVLTGVHLGGYGNDRGTDLGGLVERILDETRLPRLRLGSLEPWALPRRLLELFAESPRLLPHLHLPLQSGCDSVLKRMGRRCHTRDFAVLVDKLREREPNFNISTDIIVGFPGESEAEWQQSLAFIRRIGFSRCHVFSYSRHEQTAASRMPYPVAETVKRKRSAAVRQLSDALLERFLRRQQGHAATVLWEGKNRQGLQTGYTENYLRVIWQGPGEMRENTILKVHIDGVDATRQLCATAVL